VRPIPLVPSPLQLLLRRQDGAVTVGQAYSAGLTRTQVRTLLRHGWTNPIRGVLIESEPRDAFRASVRAALLARPKAVVWGITAARLHKLGGLPRWTPAEVPHLALPSGQSYHPRAGMQVHSGLRPQEHTTRAGFPVTTLAATVDDMALVLCLDDLICLVDSALHVGWRPVTSSKPGQRKLRAALLLADGRSESTFESLLRLLLVRAGLGPEDLQHAFWRPKEREYGRIDIAWPSIKLAVEADGREYHDRPDALYGDRRRGNVLELADWTVLRFTWVDLLHHPEEIVEQVRLALNAGRATKTAA
jgi:very-short-patch-repair endonuclease